MACTENLASDLFSLFLRMHRMMNKRLAEQGASLARTKLLLFLDRRGPSRAADIADFFDQAPRTVTEAIDGLERDGPSSGDRIPTIVASSISRSPKRAGACWARPNRCGRS